MTLLIHIYRILMLYAVAYFMILGVLASVNVLLDTDTKRLAAIVCLTVTALWYVVTLCERNTYTQRRFYTPDDTYTYKVGQKPVEK